MKITDTCAVKPSFLPVRKWKKYCCALTGKQLVLLNLSQQHFQCCHSNFGLFILTGGGKSQRCETTTDSTEIRASGQDR